MARPCSPSVQRRASARLLLPEPFGPTTALIPGANSTTVRSANNLKPCRRSATRRARALIRRALPAGLRRASTIRGRISCQAPRGPLRRRPSAARRSELPVPVPITSPSTATSTTNSRAWSGPDDSTTWYDGARARPLGQLLEPTLRALERADREIRFQLRGGQGAQPRARRVLPAVEEDRAATASNEDASRASRARPPRWDSPSPSRIASPRSIRRASRASPLALTIAARRADRTPSSSCGWRSWSASETTRLITESPRNSQAFVRAPGPRPGARAASCHAPGRVRAGRGR